MLRSLRDSVVNAASFGLVHVKAESCVRRAMVRGGGQGFSLLVDRSTAMENHCPCGAKVVATMLPSRGTVHAKEASCVDPAQRENRGRAPHTRSSPDSLLRSRPFRRTTPLPATTTQQQARAQTLPASQPSPDPAAGRRPFGARADSEPQRRSRRREPRRATQPQARALPSDAPPPESPLQRRSTMRLGSGRQPTRPSKSPSAARNGPQDAAGSSADPCVHSLQSTFQSVHPLLSSSGRGLFTKRTTSPRRERS